MDAGTSVYPRYDDRLMCLLFIKQTLLKQYIFYIHIYKNFVFAENWHIENILNKMPHFDMFPQGGNCKMDIYKKYFLFCPDFYIIQGRKYIEICICPQNMFFTLQEIPC